MIFKILQWKCETIKKKVDVLSRMLTNIVSQNMVTSSWNLYFLVTSRLLSVYLNPPKKNYNKHICNESNCHEKFSLNIFRECLCRSPIETKVRPVFYKKGLFKNPLFTFLANFVFVVSHLKILPAVNLNTWKAPMSL